MKISKIAASLFKIPIRSPPQPIFMVLGAPSSPNLAILAKNGPFFGMYGKSYTFCRTTLHGSGRQISPDLIWETNEPILSSGKPGLQHILKRKNWPRTPPYPLNSSYYFQQALYKPILPAEVDSDGLTTCSSLAIYTMSFNFKKEHDKIWLFFNFLHFRRIRWVFWVTYWA